MEDSYILRNLQWHYPNLAREAVDIVQSGDFDLIITMPNGQIWLYDDAIQRARVLPNDKNNLTEEECKKEFGLRLRRLMNRRRLTLNDLSEMTGIPAPIISNYTTGKTSPGFYNVDKIAKALNCSVDELRYY